MMHIDTSSRVEQRKFGLVMAAAICILGLLRWGIHWWRDGSAPFPVYFFAVAAVFAVLGLVAPRVLQPVFVVWMKFAEVLNWVMTRVFLSVAWYFIITPTAIIRRLAHRDDPLKRTWLSADASYWEPAEEMGEGVESFKRQF